MKRKEPKTLLKQLIKLKGSKKEVAEDLGITVAYINMILNGKMPSKRLVKLMKFYLSLS